MKILVISDVHSNYPALKAVLDRDGDADLIVCAGDVVHLGYFPHEVLDTFRKYNVHAVCGNHDKEILHARLTRKSNPFVKYNRDRLTPEDWEYLKALPDNYCFEADGISYCMRHAYGICENVNNFLLSFIEHRSVSEFDRVWRRASPVRDAKERCIILGHSHESSIIKVSEHRMVINPGTVAFHLGDNYRKHYGADYMVIENGVPSFRYTDYDRSEDIRRAKEAALYG